MQMIACARPCEDEDDRSDFWTDVNEHDRPCEEKGLRVVLRYSCWWPLLTKPTVMTAQHET